MVDKTKNFVTHAADGERPSSTSAAATSGEGESMDINRMIYRALRGRYRLTLVLALIVGGAAAAAGWIWAGPLYLGDGMVRIASALPTVIQQTDQNQPIPMFESFMQAQQELVTSRFVLEKVEQDPIWNTPALSRNRPSIAALAAGLKVDVRPRSENLRISYVDHVAAVASSVVVSTIRAYQKVFEHDDQQIEQQRLELLEGYRNKLASELDLGKAPAPTTQKSSTSAVAAQIQPPPVPPSAERLAMSDPTLRHLLDDRDRANEQLAQAEIDYGPNHPYVLHMTLATQQASARVQQYMDDYIAAHSVPDTATADSKTAVAEDQTPAPVLAPLSASMQQIQNNLDDANHRIDVLKAEMAMPKRFEIVSLGNIPVAVPGRQIKWTAFSGGLGVGLVLGIMVLIGLYRPRYNLCSDVTENFASKMRFVVAVPDLDASKKSRRWVDAAQCIHCLRQKLDQTGSAYLVTSSDWGEGRTSMVMSLALSWCGAGVRTVVVDADLATRGLTRALKLDDQPGFFEMLQEGDGAPILKVQSNGLAILPAGIANEADGLTITPVAIAQLLKRLRANFDVILIDSGPALGRVETSVLARQADGVLLTFSRGQKQTLLAKTLDELELAGAKIFGAVFNRAEPRDFDRSVQRRTGTQTTWQARSISGPLANFSPLVQSVSMSLRHDIDLYPIKGVSSPGKAEGSEWAPKLKGRDILCFSHDWNGAPLSKTHLMRLLSQQNRVLWVNSIGYRRPTASGSDIVRIFRKLWAAVRPVTEVEPNLFVLNPLAIPSYGNAWANINRRWLGGQVRRAMKRLAFNRPINFVFNPAAASVAGTLGEDKIVYYCVDEYSAFTGVNAHCMGRLEAQLLSKADLVVASSERLYLAKASANPNTVMVRHGVDFDHFRKALDADTTIPNEIAHLPRPVIGYFGLISAQWVDMDLLLHLAKTMPEASLVMLGKVAMDVSALKRLPNVHILGNKPYDTLPNYCKGFDAAIIPFPINEATLSANPLKMREYLAAGLPVISTAIPEVQATGQCRIGTDADSFVAEVRAALQQPGPSAAQSQTMRDESWAARLADVERALLAGRRPWQAAAPRAA
jgi:Mrp family chromosome partitioning ATPase/glycosyltransferase involved in cell wall biosynthesis